MPATYLRMIPENLQLGNFTYKEWPDMDAALRDQSINTAETAKTVDSDFVKAKEKAYTFTNYVTYTKETSTQIWFFKNNDMVGCLFLAKINPPYPGCDGPKDFLCGSQPEPTYKYSDDFVEGMVRLLIWLFVNDKVDMIYGKALQLELNGKWEEGSAFCDSKRAAAWPREIDIVDDTLQLDGNKARFVVVKIRKPANIDLVDPNVFIANMPKFMSYWRNK